ncbi:MAG: Rne/Rng family ribonuclease, partial [Candidatus Dadabacteria bacterium]|nr:Rne/Rng family ribonuclease [Candidatus Dadabacteria bacterium]NIS08048.1 Rne/Rng family ribonuclease [Candidatus Dadabacteria bacterium]NIY22488.1 Rne/Rng family ribonuclease [Candidatus Dadabacteria bacterium]
MENTILINRTFNETRVAFIKNDSLFELYVERTSKPKLAGNIYKAKVGKVIPGMQAAFINYGGDKAGFISAEDVYSDSFENIFLEQQDDVEDAELPSYLIQDVLTEGQDILVQILKNPSGGKGAKLSSNIALPGKYLVLLAMVDFVGVSKKIEESEERERLVEILKEIKQDNIGIIARTVSMGIDKKLLENDLEQLRQTWEYIKNKLEKHKAPVLLYEEPPLYIKTIRDLATDTTNVLVDDKDFYNQITEFIGNNFPDFDIKLDLYEGRTPLFTKYNLEKEIQKLFEKKIWLASGGYLIIEEAEALTVIDVNTGKYLSGDNQNDTIYHINKEAAVEIAKQIKLRNLVGIIVIDFIDLKEPEKTEEIYKLFLEQMKDDKARIVVHEMSQFSVVQLTRQKLRESIMEYLTNDCYHCRGTGFLKSPETVTYEIFREIK